MKAQDEQRQRTLPEDIPHLKFMGIPIEGSPLPIIEKLKGKDNFVWKVSVSFPVQQSWNAVKSMYEKFKTSYNEKYETRPECTEKLTQRFREGTGQEQWGFEDESSKWQSVFSLQEGFITLAVMYNRQTGNLFLVADYVDRVGYLMKVQIDMEDI